VRIDRGGAAQVDRFGNVNTTGVWDGDIGAHYRPPKTRMPNAGGANDIACGAKRFIIMVTHEPKRFAEKVTYMSSPGYLDGGDLRARHGFVGGGPSAIITTLGIYGRSRGPMNSCSTAGFRSQMSRKSKPIPAGRCGSRPTRAK